MLINFVGIWADDSDDEEDRRPAFRANAPKSYTTPIGFVAGGVQQAGKKTKKEDAIKVERKSDSEDDNEKPSTSFKRKDNSSSDSESEQVLRTGRCYRLCNGEFYFAKLVGVFKMSNFSAANTNVAVQNSRK